jgi:hypothetical protein
MVGQVIMFSIKYHNSVQASILLKPSLRIWTIIIEISKLVHPPKILSCSILQCHRIEAQILLANRRIQYQQPVLAITYKISEK